MRLIQTIFQAKGMTQNILPVMPMDDDGTQELAILNLYPQETFQTFLGFGGAFTQSAGTVFLSLDASAQDAVVEAYFGKDGLGYTIGRCPLDGCDFSTAPYAAVSDPADEALNGFSIREDERHILPFILRAGALCPELRVMLSPWSPPAFMKTNAQRCHGGKLLPQFRARWAEYICTYIQAYKARGIHVFAVSVQNEPNAVQDWDSCLYLGREERDFVSEYLAPALRRHGLSDIALTVWDHNKERLLDRADMIFSDPAARAAVRAIGFHWYSGDHFEALSLAARKYPEKLLIFTEGCIEYKHYAYASAVDNAERYAHELIGGMNNGLHAFLDWNLLLDHNGGPNYVGNFCEAPVMVCEDGSLQFHCSYAAIGHFSRYIRPGAVRTGSSRFSDSIELTAWMNADGKLACVILNKTERSESCWLRMNGKLYPLLLPQHSISTAVFDSI